VKPGGLLVVNASLIEVESERDDIQAIYVPASDIATDLGNVRMANMAVLGALAQATGIVSLETLAQELEAHISKRHRQWVEPNKEALQKGATYAR
jgi:2-oxoglutarate ferredoxin oxidoreductase subunit gamma